MMCTKSRLRDRADHDFAASSRDSFDKPAHSREKLLLDYASRSILALDTYSLYVTFANSPANALFGTNSMCGRHVSEIVAEPWLTWLREWAQLDHASVFELELQHPSAGTETCFRIECVPLPKVSSSSSREVGVYVDDITEHIQSQEKHALSHVEAERNRISTELHDSLAHSLNGLLWQLRSLMFRMKSNTAAAEYVPTVELVEALGRDLHREFRRAVWALGSDVLRDRSLPEALDSELRKLSDIVELHSSFEVNGTPRRLPEEIEQGAAKVFQEAVHNVIKHADCKNIHVELAYDRDYVRLTIQDDGKGFSAGVPGEGTGFGLKNMQSRAESIGGSVRIESRPGWGTKVAVHVPSGGAIDGD